MAENIGPVDQKLVLPHAGSQLVIMNTIFT